MWHKIRSDGGNARHPITVELPTNLPLVYADLSMMERVLTNLLDNAVRHTPNGGKIYLRARQQDDQLMVEVEDNGSGVPGALRYVVPAPVGAGQGQCGRVARRWG
jgi:K+-sensing histidine kinase KdpD